MKLDKSSFEDEYFQFLGGVVHNDPVHFTKFHVRSDLYFAIRKNMRRMFAYLYEVEDVSFRVKAIRKEIYRQHFSPCSPNSDFMESIGLTSFQYVENTLGLEAASVWKQLSELINLSNSMPHPFIRVLIKLFDKSQIDGQVSDERIWCSSKDIEFLTENLPAISERNLFVQQTSYRMASPFQTLNAIGPFRGRGWTALPRSVLSAPKFHELRQILWEDSYNDENYFSDPLIPDISYEKLFYKIDDILIEDNVGDDLPKGTGNSEAVDEALDDFEFFRQRPIEGTRERNCLAFSFSDDVAVLVPPRMQHLVFVLDEFGARPEYVLAEEIQAGSFLVRHDVEADLGVDSAAITRESYASIWKKRLNQMYGSHYELLMQKMSQSGIDLKDLDRAARMWKEDGGVTISGPQSPHHFKKLILNVLGFSVEELNYKKAWKEIQNSRVSAILNGKVESAIINEQLQNYITNISELIQKKTLDEDHFKITLSEEFGLSGIIEFYKIAGVDSGYSAPVDLIGLVSKYKDIEKYQVEL